MKKHNLKKQNLNLSVEEIQDLVKRYNTKKISLVEELLKTRKQGKSNNK